jgi:hypothetical protein
MYDRSIDRDVVRTELEYRLGRIHDELAVRRQRRGLGRRGRVVDQGSPADVGWTTVR